MVISYFTVIIWEVISSGLWMHLGAELLQKRNTSQENKKTKFHCISLSFISVQEYNQYCNYKQLKMGLLCLEVHVEKRKKKKQFSPIHSYLQ